MDYNTLKKEYDELLIKFEKQVNLNSDMLKTLAEQEMELNKLHDIMAIIRQNNVELVEEIDKSGNFKTEFVEDGVVFKKSKKINDAIIFYN